MTPGVQTETVEARPSLQRPVQPSAQQRALSSARQDQTLDPADWEAFREQAHRMLDDMLDYTKSLRQRPVWQRAPEEVRARFRGGAMPSGPTALAGVHEEFLHSILPFAAGNAHPGFMGWVQGGGTPVGMLAEMLAAGLNANVGGRDQIPVEVERQITRWMQQLFGFPPDSTGLFVTGTSMANFIATVVARDAALGGEARRQGVAAQSKRLTAYASAAVHSCVGKALDLCGVGSDALRTVATDSRGRIDLDALAKEIEKDRAAGCEPFLLVGTAGTVDTGAIDDLSGLADLARREKLWFHVDGAFGALAMLAPELAPKLRGIERADSLAFDFHKWGQVPYDAGFVLVRDGQRHRNAFAASSAYLRRETRGLAAGSPWPCDYGPDLSRSFRALKTWFTLKVYGAEAIGASIARTCALARILEQRIAATPELELLAPVELNIVCFRYRFPRAPEESERCGQGIASNAPNIPNTPNDSNAWKAPDSSNLANECNARIAIALQESGIVAPSTTILDGRLAIRAAIVNHRTGEADLDRLLEGTLKFGRAIVQEREAARLAAARAAARDAPPRVRWEAELAEVENQLAANPQSIDLRFRRASLSAELGRLVEARNGYIEVLQREPFHLAALNNLANVLIAVGHRQAARIALNEAVTRHPDNPISRVNFGHFLLEESDRLTTRGEDEQALEHKRAAREQYEQALRVQPDCEKAHEGLSYLLGDLGDAPGAAWHRREAFRNRCIVPLPYRGAREPVSVLLLASTLGGNVRMQRFLDDRIFETFVVVPEFYNPRTPLPSHHLAINGIGDAEVSHGALHAAQAVLALSQAPVVNPLAAVLATSRSNNAKRFRELPGVVAPLMATLPREQLSDAQAAHTLAELGFAFPLLLRAPGFHTGQHFVKVESSEALPAALEGLPGGEIIVMEYLDARGADGKTRKYRAMIIDGQIYPLHLAISSHWKIHYFTAEMAEHPEHRAEEAAFLEDMPGVLGAQGMKALAGIQSTLGLDYAGIDFGLNAKGEVLVFEANATMAVNPPGGEECWKYRVPPYRRIREAVQKMLLDRARPMAQASGG